MGGSDQKRPTSSARDRFLALSLESTRKNYYPQLLAQLKNAREDKRQLQLLIDNMPARVSYIDNEERFVFINETYEKFFGVKKEEIVGCRVITIAGEENYAKLKKYLIQALQGKCVEFEIDFKTRAGEDRWIEISYVPNLDSDGKVLGFYGFSIDRTEKKQIEREKKILESRLHQAQKMEAIGTLAGGIAHDFNNILSGIFGYSQLAESHIHNPEQAVQYIRRIFEGAQRASLLVQQILTFSRHSDYDRKPLNVLVLIKEALKMLRATIPTNIEIVENLLSRKKVFADSTQIHQVIMNLCTNAYHAMADKGGILSVTLQEVQVARDQMALYPHLPPGMYLRLEVSDTGPGIEPEIINRIFDPYFTTKEVGKGTGLGLAVVDGIVKKHNGFVKVDSEPGHGARFNVYLPVIKENFFQESKAEATHECYKGTERIMFVDDEEDIRETLAHLLSHIGYHVVGFENGERALYEFKQAPYQYDLVITDMTMPLLTGEKMAREMLKIRKDLPIILCTGYHEKFKKEDALDMGIQAYMEKPVSTKELSLTIRRLLDKFSEV